MDSLRELNTKLLAEISELRKENTVIPDLRNKLSVSDAEIAELKRSNIEFLRANKEYNERRDAENAKLRAGIVELKSENAELRDRVTKVEQRQVLNEPRGASHNSSNNSSPSFNSVAVPEAITVPTNSAKRLNGKSLEEKEMNNFLVEANKKSVSDEIRQRNKEKKFRDQDSSLVNTSKLLCDLKNPKESSRSESCVLKNHLSDHN